jgi:hypothetical protein
MSKVSLSAIKGYETGRNMPGARELRDLCRVLRVTPNKLLFGLESPFPVVDSTDPASTPGEIGLEVQRGRISQLVNMLSFEESHSIYSLVRSIATSRFGEDVVQSATGAVDVMTGIKLMAKGHMEAHKLISTDPKVLRELGEALKAAGDEASKFAED